MGQIVTATLDSLVLPKQFSYRLYVPPKRRSVIRTVNGVVTQANSSLVVHGDGTIPWVCRAMYPDEFQNLFNKYNVGSLSAVTFTGYWGESYSVYFSELDPPQVRGRLVDAAGQFQVISVSSGLSMSC